MNVRYLVKDELKKRKKNKNAKHLIKKHRSNRGEKDMWDKRKNVR